MTYDILMTRNIEKYNDIMTINVYVNENEMQCNEAYY